MVEGGQRRPAGTPQLAAWRAIAASLRGETGPVAGRCPACGQPMTADRAAPPFPWTLPLPEGELRIEGDAITGPAGPLDLAAAHRLAEAAFREPLEAGQTAFGAVLLSAMTLPMLLWATALFVVLWFLYNVLAGTVGF